MRGQIFDASEPVTILSFLKTFRTACRDWNFRWRSCVVAELIHEETVEYLTFVQTAAKTLQNRHCRTKKVGRFHLHKIFESSAVNVCNGSRDRGVFIRNSFVYQFTESTAAFFYDALRTTAYVVNGRIRRLR